MVSPIWRRLYGFLSRIGPCRLIRDIHHMLELVKPLDEDSLARETVALCGKELLYALLIFLCGLRFLRTASSAARPRPPGGEFSYILALILVVYIICRHVLNRRLEREEIKLLKQLESCIADVRHHYHSCGMVEEALYEAISQAGREASLHMERIYRILVGGEEEAEEQYRETAPSKFLTTFLALCKITIRYGDTLHEGASLFLANLNHLKNEINVEILKREQIRHAFSGLVFMTVLPVFCLRLIESFSIGSLPELNRYYYGSYGMVVTVLILFSALLSYQIIYRLKGVSRIYRRDHVILERLSRQYAVERLLDGWIYRKPGPAYRLDRLLKRTGEGITLKQHLVQRWLTGIAVFIGILLLAGQSVMTKKWAAINDTGDWKGTSSMNRSSELEDCRILLKEVGLKVKGLHSPAVLENRIREELMERYGLEEGSLLLESMEKEIVDRVKKYHSIRFNWFYLLSAIAAGIAASKIPLLLLRARGFFMQAGMEEEVMQLQSILIMLMHIKQMSVLTILEWMENFGELFRASIMECVDLYPYDEERAFQILKEQEPFPPFVRIVEDLEACDRVGIENAFDELVGQRSYLEEKRKQENEMALSDKGVIGRAAAYVPLVLTIGLYLIVPFVMESMNQLLSYVQQLQL